VPQGRPPTGRPRPLLRDAEFCREPARTKDLDAARERAFGHVTAVGGADDVGAALDRRGDEVNVVRIELTADHAKLLGKPFEQFLAGAPGEVVDDLADRLV
jgi:hypothetical protein